MMILIYSFVVTIALAFVTIKFQKYHITALRSHIDILDDENSYLLDKLTEREDYKTVTETKFNDYRSEVLTNLIEARSLLNCASYDVDCTTFTREDWEHRRKLFTDGTLWNAKS